MDYPRIYIPTCVHAELGKTIGLTELEPRPYNFSCFDHSAISGEHPGVYIIVYEHDVHLNDELLYAELGIYFLHLLHVNCNH